MDGAGVRSITSGNLSGSRSPKHQKPASSFWNVAANRKSLNKNDRDQVLWARETEPPPKPLFSLKPLDATTWLRSLLPKVFPANKGILVE